MARRRGRVVRRGAGEWAEILGKLEASGLSAQAFSRREGFALSSLQRWRQRLRTKAHNRFVELTPPMSAAAEPGGWSVELALPSGVTIRLR